MDNKESIEKISEYDLVLLVDRLEEIEQRFLKLVGVAALVLCIPLFIPISILSIFSRKARNMTFDSQFLFFELGPFNVLYFLVIPALIILGLCYYFLFRIPQLKKDIKEQEKLVGIIKVKEIKRLDEGLIKELMGSSDHKVVYHHNNYDEIDMLFLAQRNPEYFNLKGCKVEVSKNAKISLKREDFYD
ncbi:MAG: hypothetical protein KIG88_01155 [Weeksellaceae bacterium]|nr:hypothetical protein [Weeksellaceae bacterium]